MASSTACESSRMPWYSRSVSVIAGATVIVNIWGTSIAEYGEVAAFLDSESDGITALEINISCPNVKAGGAAFGTDPHLAAEVVRTVRDRMVELQHQDLPFLTKSMLVSDAIKMIENEPIPATRRLLE